MSGMLGWAGAAWAYCMAIDRAMAAPLALHAREFNFGPHPHHQFVHELARQQRYESELEAGFGIPPARRETIQVRWPVRGQPEGLRAEDDTL